MMTPRLTRAISFSASRVQKNVPLRWTPIMRCHASSLMFWVTSQCVLIAPSAMVSASRASATPRRRSRSSAGPRDPRVVDEDVEPPPARPFDLVEHRAHLRAIADVPGNGEPSPPIELPHGLLRGLDLQIVDDDERPFRREPKGDGPPNPRPASGHERDLILELHDDS